MKPYPQAIRRQQQLLAAIKYRTEFYPNEPPPTLALLSDTLGWNNKSLVLYHIRKLAAAGKIIYNGPRTIQLNTQLASDGFPE